jgi:hypothetical protein
MRVNFYTCLQRIPKFVRIGCVMILLLEILSRFPIAGNIRQWNLTLMPCISEPNTSLNLSLIGMKKESLSLTSDFYRKCYEETGDTTCKLMINCHGLSKEPCGIIHPDDLRKYENKYGDCLETRRFFWIVIQRHSDLPCKKTN